MTYYRDKDTTYPPVAATCPDFWMVSDENPNKCKIPAHDARNVGSIYISNPAGTVHSLDPNNNQLPGLNMTEMDIDFTGKHWASTCTKQTWANQYGLVWDGVTNFNGC